MQKPGILARTADAAHRHARRACGSGTGQNPLAKHAHTAQQHSSIAASQHRSIAWGGGGEAAMTLSGGQTSPFSLFSTRSQVRTRFLRTRATTIGQEVGSRSSDTPFEATVHPFHPGESFNCRGSCKPCRGKEPRPGYETCERRRRVKPSILADAQSMNTRTVSHEHVPERGSFN